MLATERIVSELQRYLRSGLGTPNITILIEPLLKELQELRNYLYRNILRIVVENIPA